MKKLKSVFEHLKKEIEGIIEKRVEIYNDRSPQWRDAIQGERYEKNNERLKLITSLIEDIIDD